PAQNRRIILVSYTGVFVHPVHHLLDHLLEVFDQLRILIVLLSFHTSAMSKIRTPSRRPNPVVNARSNHPDSILIGQLQEFIHGIKRILTAKHSRSDDMPRKARRIIFIPYGQAVSTEHLPARLYDRAYSVFLFERSRHESLRLIFIE